MTTSYEERISDRLGKLESAFNALIAQDRPASKAFGVGRVPFGGSNGLLTDDSGLTYDAINDILSSVNITTSNSVGFGGTIQSNIRLYAKGNDTSGTNYALYVSNSADAPLLAVLNDGNIGINTGYVSVINSGGFGAIDPTNVRLFVRGHTADSSKYGLYVDNSVGTTMFYVRNDGVCRAATSFIAPVFLSGSNQVVGARKTGWGTPTGTLYRTALTNASTQAQFNQAVMAIVTDLIAHGLFGA